METTWRNLRQAVRGLAKAPGFTVTVVLTLGLGIGASCAIFSVVHAVLLRPLPARDPARLVAAFETYDRYTGSVSAPNLLDWRQENTVFAALSAYQETNAAWRLGDSASPERVAGVAADGDFFPLLGVAPRLGRTFGPDEAQPGRDGVVVLSEPLWRRLFGADPGVVGRSVQLDGRTVTVVGVMPASCQLPSAAVEFWRPLVFPSDALRERGNHSYAAVARLKPGVSLGQAQAAMDGIGRELARRYPDDQTGRGVRLQPWAEEIAGEVRRPLWLLLGAVGCVWLIACANVTGLLLARTVARRPEIVVRAALGASCGQLLAQWLTESLLLAALGGLVGLLSASWALAGVRLLGGDSLPRAAEIRIDGPVLGFALLLVAGTGLAGGLAPAWQAVAQLGRGTVLRDAGRTRSVSAGRQRLRGALIVGEVALTLPLLVTAGLLLRGFDATLRTPTGLAAEHLLTGRVALPAAGYPDAAALTEFFRRLTARLAALPGCQAAGAINLLPIERWGWNSDFQIEGRPPFPRDQTPWIETRVVTDDYFRAAGISLLAGRFFDGHDQAESSPVVLINETTARRYWTDPAAAVGARLTDLQRGPAQVVGVVSDVRQSGLGKPVRIEVYFPLAQAWHGETPGLSAAQEMSVCLRTAGDPAAAAESLRRVVRELDPALPVFRVRPMAAVISGSLDQSRLQLWLLGIFAANAVALTGVGLHGLLSYLVAQRNRELGIRLALGARPADVRRLVVGQGARLLLPGLAVGVAAALAAGRLLASLQAGAGGVDPLLLGAAATLLGGVALTASWLPAFRAGRVDPAVVLRDE